MGAYLGMHLTRCAFASMFITASPWFLSGLSGCSDQLNSDEDRGINPNNVPPAAVGMATVSNIGAGAVKAVGGFFNGVEGTNPCWILVSLPVAIVAFPILLFGWPIVDAGEYVINRFKNTN